MFAAETLALLYGEGRRTNAVHGGVWPSAVACFCLFENGTHDELCDDALFADSQNQVQTMTEASTCQASNDSRQTAEGRPLVMAGPTCRGAPAVK
jgi:hypothetical protein